MLQESNCRHQEEDQRVIVLLIDGSHDGPRRQRQVIVRPGEACHGLSAHGERTRRCHGLELTLLPKESLARLLAHHVDRIAEVVDGRWEEMSVTVV